MGLSLLSGPSRVSWNLSKRLGLSLLPLLWALILGKEHLEQFAARGKGPLRVVWVAPGAENGCVGGMTQEERLDRREEKGASA